MPYLLSLGETLFPAASPIKGPSQISPLISPTFKPVLVLTSCAYMAAHSLGASPMRRWVLVTRT